MTPTLNVQKGGLSKRRGPKSDKACEAGAPEGSGLSATAMLVCLLAQVRGAFALAA
jgi:hypothetical protein